MKGGKFGTNLFMGIAVMMARAVKKAVMVVVAGCGKSSSVQGPPDTHNTDSAQVTVVNGYGTGRYKIGDTVHIWSIALGPNMVFDKWTGNVSLQQNGGEWHNTFVMGTQDVTVTGTYHSFSVAQRLFVTDEIDGMYAAHQFYTDLNRSTIQFLDSQCQ